MGNMTYHAQNSLSVTSKVSLTYIIFGIGKVTFFGSYPIFLVLSYFIVEVSKYQLQKD
jgi:hypothetical protein